MEKVFAVIIKLRKTGERFTIHVRNVDNVVEARDSVIEAYGDHIRCLAMQIQ